jgi:hypothetical protein
MSGRSIRWREAERVVALMDELSAAGFDGDDLLYAIDERLPRISFRYFIGGLALHRAQSGAPGYRIVPVRGRA